MKTTKDTNLKEMSAIILSGGKSSRMGRDKSTVLFEGKPLLLRAVGIIQQLFGEIVIVANQAMPFQTPGSIVVSDEIPYLGPLGGISAGLKASSYETSFVMAVDMPFISKAIIEYLAGFADKADIAAPSSEHGIEPLFAFYSRRCLPVIDAALARGDRKVLSVLDLLNVKVVDYGKLRELAGTDDAFFNINEECDLEAAELKARLLRK